MARQIDQENVTTKANAIELLEGDHREVESLLAQYGAAGDASTKQELAETICEALTAHATIEEEIFYPAVAEGVDGAEGLVEEARSEHATVKRLINDIESADAGDSSFDSLVRELGNNVKHHVEEEESELFPKVRASDLDLSKLGERMSERKVQLMA